ncbi:MAG: hypothetical protein ACFCVD_24885 [Nodosilinea sp.]
MTTSPSQEPTLQDLADKLDRLTAQDLAVKIDRLTADLEQTHKWQDRTWDVVKWVGGISAGLAISAAIALVGIVLKQNGQ